MNAETLLLRQVNPSWVKDDFTTSQAFGPTPKDKGLLSVDNGDLITAKEVFTRHTVQLGLKSAGVVAVSVQEAHQERLSSVQDGRGYPTHVSIQFEESLTKGQQKAIAKRLRSHARPRGWLHRST